jgi:hypothetical protein
VHAQSSSKLPAKCKVYYCSDNILSVSNIFIWIAFYGLIAPLSFHLLTFVYFYDVVTPCSGNVPNGEWDNCDRVPGSTCSYTCDVGYHAKSTAPATCNDQGTWEGAHGLLCAGNYLPLFELSTVFHIAFVL